MEVVTMVVTAALAIQLSLEGERSFSDSHLRVCQAELAGSVEGVHYVTEDEGHTGVYQLGTHKKT